MTHDVDVLVIGGGISGLSLLFWLQQGGLRAELWERDQRLGGKIRTFHEHGYQTEAGASMVMNFRPEVRQLLAATGLEAMCAMRREQAGRHRYLLRDGKLVAASSRIAGQFLSANWNTSTKLRLLLEWIIPRGGGAEETVSDFIRRRLGAEILERAVEPFVAGHLASDPDLANARSVLPGLTALEQRYGSITVGLLANKLKRRSGTPFREFFSFHHGMETLITGLASACGATTHCAHNTVKLECCKQGWKVHAATGKNETTRWARHVALCIPAYSAAVLLADTQRELPRLLRRISYAPMAVVHTGFDRSAIEVELDGAGFLIPRTEQRVITGNLWHSALFQGVCPAGKALLSSYLGGARAPAAARMDDAASVAQVLADLQQPLRLRAAPEMVRIDRHQRALPLYHGRYPALVKAIKAQARATGRLSLVANYLDGISVRDRIVQSHAVAEDIKRALSRHVVTRTTRIPPVNRSSHPVLG